MAVALPPISKLRIVYTSPSQSTKYSVPDLTMSCRGHFLFHSSRNSLGASLTTSLGLRAATQQVLQCNCLNSTEGLPGEMDRLGSIIREIGFAGDALDSLLVDSPSLGLASSRKIRSRVLSLVALGVDNVALYRLITDRPDILVADEMEPLITFLFQDLEGNLESELVERLLTATDPISLLGFCQKVRLLLQSGIPKEKISYFLCSMNLKKFLRKKSVEDIERTINILKDFGGTRIIMRHPAILNHELDTQLIPRINFIWELSGKDDIATGAVLHRLPAILAYSVQHMEGHVNFLRNYAGLSQEQIFKIILMFPNVISTSRMRKLHPRIEFLKQCRLGSEDIYKFLTKAPLFLALSEDNLTQKLGFLFKIGYEHRTKEFAMAVGAVTRTSCANLQKVIGVFLSNGLSFSDILAMSKKHPQVLQYNHCSSQQKMQYLQEEMGREVKELLVFPAFLGYKLDSRIRHRYEERKCKDRNMSLNNLLTVSAEKFLVE